VLVVTSTAQTSSAELATTPERGVPTEPGLGLVPSNANQSQEWVPYVIPKCPYFSPTYHLTEVTMR
jgi:hypothetical protein